MFCGRSLHNLILDSELSDSMLVVAGPRQVGKTTSAKLWLSEEGCAELYFNWDDIAVRRRYRKDPHFFDALARTHAHPRLVLDEIHKQSGWKTLVKGYFDVFGRDFSFLLTGSAKLETFQRSGDSLLGRYHLLHLMTLTPHEVTTGKAKERLAKGPNINLDAWHSPFPETFMVKKSDLQDAVEGLLAYSGFPAPFLKSSERSLRLWHNEYRQRLLREDLRDLTKLTDMERAEHVLELLPDRVGSPLSLNSLREDVMCSHESVRAILSAFEKLYLTANLKPYSKKLQYSLKKGPKTYLMDWTCVDDPGARFENFMAIQLITYCQHVTDGGWANMELCYLRDKQKREVDFLIVKDKKPLWLIECKSSPVTIVPSLRHFHHLLTDVKSFCVVRGPDVLKRLEPDSWLVSAARFFNLLWK